MGVAVGSAVGGGDGIGLAVGPGRGVGVLAGSGVGEVVVLLTPEAHADKTNSNEAITTKNPVGFISSHPRPHRVHSNIQPAQSLNQA